METMLIGILAAVMLVLLLAMAIQADEIDSLKSDNNWHKQRRKELGDLK